MDAAELRFGEALSRYRDAKARDEQGERTIEAIDEALDSLMATPSPSVAAFSEKMRVLEAEYGLDAQSRHVGAIYADVRTWSSA